jgi:predicted DNA-binding protein YlxM (UPF0122 family)
MNIASNSAGSPHKERKKKERTAEKQKEIDEKMKEIHAEQNTMEKQIKQEINNRANKMIETYKAKLGRPTALNETLMDEIVDRMSNGQTLTYICSLDHMPSPSSVIRETERNPSFRERYTRAREHQSDVLFNQCLDIADDSTNDIIKNDDTGEKTINNAAIQRDRLRIETRFRMAGKLSLRYHDKPPMIGNGANVTVNSLNINARDMTPDARDRLRAILIEAKNNSQVIDHNGE